MQTNQLQFINFSSDSSNKVTSNKPKSNTTVINPFNKELIKPQEGVYEKINNIFSQRDSREKEVQETRALLEHYSNEFNDTDIITLNAETQFLVEVWLDQFEKEVFNGMTLRELLHLT